MKRTAVIIVLFFVSFIFMSSGMHSVAAEGNVKDCLENDADCLKDMEQPDEEMNEDTDELVGESAGTTSIFFNIVKMVVALLLVLALIYFILYLVKRRNKLFQNMNTLENLGGISVGQNKSVQLVRIGEKIYVLGVGDNVELLQKLSEEEAELIIEQQEEQTSQSVPLLKDLFKRKKTDNNNPQNKSVNSDFSTSLRDELTKLRQNRNKMIDHYKEKDD